MAELRKQAIPEAFVGRTGVVSRVGSHDMGVAALAPCRDVS